MRGYAGSRFRLLLLMLMLVMAVVTATSTFGQDAGSAAPAEAKGASTFQLIFSHLNDPIFWIIAALSVTGLTFIIQGFIQNRSEALMPEATTNRIREMIEARQFRELIEFTDANPSFVSRALNASLKRAPQFINMKEAMETSLGEQTAEQFRKIEYLNIIGNLGPLLGLLGTVLGMIQAFQAVAATHGQADVARLSDGISTALTHTFLGLFLAVPCLAAFGVLRTIVDRLTVRGSLIAEELLLMMRPSDPRPGAVPARPIANPGFGTGAAIAPTIAPPPHTVITPSPGIP